MNAYRLALRHPDKYKYVEGVANYAIPTEHAWCVAEDGTVVDPTWRKGRIGGEPEYFGIPIRLDYVLKVMVETRTYSVLWNYSARFPMLRDDASEWRA